MKFKTIVGRVSYADEFDTLLEKAVAETEAGFSIEEIKIATSDRMIVAIIVYKEKKSKK